MISRCCWWFFGRLGIFLIRMFWEYHIKLNRHDILVVNCSHVGAPQPMIFPKTKSLQLVLYAQFWTFPFCDNPGDLSVLFTADGSFQSVVHQTAYNLV